ncbi:hypothetical protein M0802_008590 [Mischocyttarus mexicanus]|nr:hypothetical protein M0802_008590 [Mischocyttarus mexicanus]
MNITAMRENKYENGINKREKREIENEFWRQSKRVNILNTEVRVTVLSGQFTGFTGYGFESPSSSGLKLVDGVQAETIEATTVRYHYPPLAPMTTI